MSATENPVAGWTSPAAAPNGIAPRAHTDGGGTSTGNRTRSTGPLTRHPRVEAVPQLREPETGVAGQARLLQQHLPVGQRDRVEERGRAVGGLPPVHEDGVVRSGDDHPYAVCSTPPRRAPVASNTTPWRTSPVVRVADVAVSAVARARTTSMPGCAHAVSTDSLSSTAYSRGSHRPPPRTRVVTHRAPGGNTDTSSAHIP